MKSLVHLGTSHLSQKKLHRRLMTQFADKYGLVYFGYVDQRKDEHSLVRGLTLSPTAHDSGYCIGTIQNYDIVVLERRDVLHHPGKPSVSHGWIIMQFDLHTRVDLPHIFIGLHTHDDTFYAQLFTKFRYFVPIPFQTLDEQNALFMKQYSVYASAHNATQVEVLCSGDFFVEYARRFGSRTMEVMNGSLYIYSQDHHITASQLEAMLKQGLWLADQLDRRSLMLI